MSDESRHTYEGMFLLPQAATADLKSAIGHVEELLHRTGAEVLSLTKWDERRLAYEIKGNKRGVYLLVYFRAAGSKLVGLERDCNLSEHLLRAMITRADHVTPETIAAADGRSQLEDEIRLRGEQGPADAESRTKVEHKPVAESAAGTAVADDEPGKPAPQKSTGEPG